jgi:hypothetical protein
MRAQYERRRPRRQSHRDPRSLSYQDSRSSNYHEERSHRVEREAVAFTVLVTTGADDVLVNVFVNAQLSSRWKVMLLPYQGFALQGLE